MKHPELDPAKIEERKAAMMAAVGVWKDRTDLADTETYVRRLRKDFRLEQLLGAWSSDRP